MSPGSQALVRHGVALAALVLGPAGAAAQQAPGVVVSIAFGEGARATGVAVSPDGALAAVAMAPGPSSPRATVELWSLSSRKPVGVIQTDASRVADLAFAPDGKLLALATDSGVVVLDVASRERIPTASFPPLSVTDLDVCPSGATVAYAGGRDVIRVAEMTTGRELFARKGAAAAVAFSPDCRSLAVAIPDNPVDLWDLATGESRHFSAWKCRSLAFSSDGARLLCAEEKVVVVLDVAAGARVFGHCCGNCVPATGAAISPDGRRVACASAEAVDLWELAPELAEGRIQLDFRATRLGKASGVVGARLAFGNAGRTLLTLDERALNFADLAALEGRSDEAENGRLAAACVRAFAGGRRGHRAQSTI